MDENKLFIYKKFKYVNNNKGNVLILPDEVLSIILRQLDQKSLNNSILCSRLYLLIKPLLYENIIVYNPIKLRSVEGYYEHLETVVSIKNFIKLINGYSFEPQLMKSVKFINCNISVELYKRLPLVEIEIVDDLEHLKGFEDFKIKFDIECDRTFEYINFTLNKLKISKLIDFNDRGNEKFNNLRKLDIFADEKTFHILKSHKISFQKLKELKIRSDKRIEVPFTFPNLEKLSIITSKVIFRNKFHHLHVLELLPSCYGFDLQFLNQIDGVEMLSISHLNFEIDDLKRLNLKQLFYKCHPIEHNLIEVDQRIENEVMEEDFKRLVRSLTLDIVGYKNQIYKIENYDSLKELVPIYKPTSEVKNNFV
ncbi:hypothetical protein CLIB1444_07S07184 [[Candida] jaroonii]|uniref:Uncharacterized protein n=1 Tax=[Candida] jaroonii TaxID=467808 RepID=A0ACA9YAC9_9ASCO|nr:hypothetical protein CLIB1444_07S07184 [[Candida] jaroonii]